MSRGLLATCYARPTGACSAERIARIARTTSTPTSRSSPSPPRRRRPSRCSARTRRTSRARFDERTGTVIAMCAIDNLTKGASGGAVQAANVALGLDETAGLAVDRPRTVTAPTRTSTGTSTRARGLQGGDARRGAAVHPPFRRQDRRRQVRRQRARRHLRPRCARVVRRRHRADAPRRHAPGRRARRRTADLRPDGAARQGDHVRRRAAGHRRRDGRHRPDGAAGPGQPAARGGDQRPRPVRRRDQWRRRRPDPGGGPRPRARLRRRRHRDQPGGDPRPDRRRVHPGDRHDRQRRRRSVLQHQCRHGGRCDRRGARGREARLPHRHRGPAARRRRPGQPRSARRPPTNSTR